MKQKIFAFIMLGAFLLGAVALAFAGDPPARKAARANALVTALPASDAALSFDSKRFFAEAMPQILSGNQPLLTDITSKVDEFKTRTGLDLRQFQHVVVGANVKPVAAGRFDVEPLILARGNFNADALVAIAKLASNGKYREEKIGAKTVYIFSAKEMVEQHKGKVTNSMLAKALDLLLAGLNRELALTTFDGGTLTLGSVERVREMLDAKAPRLNGEVLDALSRRPNSVMSFAAKVPTGLTPLLGLDDDELGRNLGAIRLLSGAMDVAAGNASVSIAARTVEPAQAEGLNNLLKMVQSGFSGVLKGSKREDQKVYGRMLENARIAQTGNELTLDVQVPQADINVLIAPKK